jgi:hypothetical protein
VRFLANRDSSLRFGLLTDFPDADAELLPTDDTLLRHAGMHVESLNGQYGDDTFYLSTDRAGGTPANGCGWDTSASGASSPT